MSEIVLSSPSIPYRRRFRDAFGCLSDRTFGPWFVAQIFSASGGLTQSVAAAWLMYRYTHSATHLALLSAAMMLPVLLGSTWSGVLADRLDRRRLLMATQAGFATIGTLLAVAAATSVLSPGLLYLAAALTGSVLAVDGPARQVYVLDIVGTERLASAVSLYEVVMNASRIVGPGVGGLLLGAYGPAVCFTFNASCFVPTLAVLVLHGRRHVTLPATDVVQRPHARGAMRAGLRYAFGSPLIRSCLVLAGLGGILFNSTILFPLLAARSFHLGSDGYGLLMAAFGVGALPGALLAATTARRPDGAQVGALAVLTGTAMLVTAAAPIAALAYLGMALVGFAAIWFIAVANTLVQLVSAPAMRGRVMGAWTMMLPGLSPLTGLAVAWLADACGPRTAFATTGFLIGVAAVGPVLAGRRARVEVGVAPAAGNTTPVAIASAAE